MGRPYANRYRVIFSVKDIKSLKVTVPYSFIEKLALRHSLTVAEFLSQYDAIPHLEDNQAVFGVPFIFYTFEPRKEKHE